MPASDDNKLFSKPEVTAPQLALVASLFWLLSANAPFLTTALLGRSWADVDTWRFAAALAGGVGAIHLLLLSLLAHPRVIKPALMLLCLVAAAAHFFSQRFNLYLDPSMMRNVLRTNPTEAGELLSGAMVLHLLLFAGVPALLLWRVRVRNPGWARALAHQGLLALVAVALLVACVLLAYQPLSSLMRNHKELRYRITPANVLWSTGAVLTQDLRGAAKGRESIGDDAQQGPSWAQRRKPLVVVVVVGETARAANWGLSGYARQTTPQLAQLPVVNFTDVSACGTNTETSVPCMFAPVGRRDYDESRIRGQQSLLHVLSKAQVQVHWRDNQSGCKGVCDGLPNATAAASAPAVLCPGGVCADEALVHDIRQRLATASGTQVWVLHMLGSHGPSYFRRYPPAFARFQPECKEDDLSRCPIPHIVNSYDNTVLYTDHVLAQAITQLTAAQDRVDSALVYVSDHGESLGEKGLFLHGIPYAIAPDVQRKVPMVMWFSAGLDAAAGLKPGCLGDALRQQAGKAVSHDNLFHTVLGLVDVRTALQEPTLDLTQACR
ncbi:MAG: phosphoethanolamine--lipid A transferase [Rubrivivax sp.]|nr:phosphoethanolamine--lipid A transferase [Rubrivivax sp.]